MPPLLEPSTPYRHQSETGMVHLFLFLSLFIIVVAHLILGSGIFIVAFAALTILVGIYPISLFGLLNVGVLVTTLVAFRYVGFPFVIKLVMGQPLQSNLEQPLSSFAIVLVGVLAYLAAFLLAVKTPVGRPFLQPVADSAQLRRISIGAFAVGGLANAFVAISRFQDVSAVTVSNFFVPFLHLALISAVAASIVRSKGRKGWDHWVLFIILVEIGFAMIRNSRAAMVEIIIAYFLTAFAFRGAINWKKTIVFGVIATTMVAAITPIALSVRKERSEISWLEMIKSTIYYTINFDEALENYERVTAIYNLHGHYLNYYGSTRNILQRVSMINHVDVSKSGTDRAGTIGFNDLAVAVERSLPRILAPNKPTGYGHGDWINCELAVRCVLGNYSTVPLVGNAYAALGWLGVVIYPLFFGYTIILMLKKISGVNLHMNIWALFALLFTHNAYVEGSSHEYVVLLIRTIPQNLIVMFVLLKLSSSRLLSHRQRYSSEMRIEG